MNILTTYTTLDCCVCGILFAVPEQVEQEWHNKGKSFYCPNGHSQHFTESTATKLKKERAAREEAERRATARLELLRAEERSHAATRGVVTKQRKKLERVSKGICPCCKRTLKDLARHMASQHPEYKGQPQ